MRSTPLSLAALLLLVCSLAWGARARAAEPYVLVSDIDDTIKLTHVLKPSEAAINGFFGKKAFVGMAALYQRMITFSGLPNTPERRSMIFLSASPTFIRGSLWDQLITINHFPPGRFVLRGWVAQPSIPKYKQDMLRNIAHRYDHPLVLVGDDTEHDPEVFLEFKSHQPANKVATILIRRNIMRPLPAGAEGFYSAFDMALHELEAGRLGPEDVVAVGNAIIYEATPDRLFPSFSHCPTPEELAAIPTGPVAAAHPEVLQARADVETYINNVCSQRATQASR